MEVGQYLEKQRIMKTCITLIFFIFNAYLVASQSLMKDSLLFMDSNYREVEAVKLDSNIKAICFCFDSLVMLNPFNYSLLPYSEDALAFVLNVLNERMWNIRTVDVIVYDKKNGESIFPRSYVGLWARAVRLYIMKNSGLDEGNICCQVRKLHNDSVKERYLKIVFSQ